MARLRRIQGVDMSNTNKLKVVVVAFLALIMTILYFSNKAASMKKEQLHEENKQLQQKIARKQKENDRIQKESTLIQQKHEQELQIAQLIEKLGALNPSTRCYKRDIFTKEIMKKIGIDSVQFQYTTNPQATPFQERFILNCLSFEFPTEGSLIALTRASWYYKWIEEQRGILTHDDPDGTHISVHIKGSTKNPHAYLKAYKNKRVEDGKILRFFDTSSHFIAHIKKQHVQK